MSSLSSPNWPAVTEETVRILRDMLRFDTSNPPGNEMAAAQHVARLLREDGVEPVVIETAPGRGNTIGRLRGSGAAAPLLLYSHLDVVPVEPERWTVDPFSGEIRNGYVYGRGALDMKGIGAMQLMVFLLAVRAANAGAPPLKRDVIIAFTSDEETSANQGIGLLVDKHPDLLRAEYALSEFGGFSMHIGGRTFYPIQTAEKGTCWMRIRARGRPGHASVPHQDNAVVHLSRAIGKLHGARTATHMTRTARGFIHGLADGLGGAVGGRLRAVVATAEAGAGRDAEPIWQDRILRETGLLDELYAVTHNTLTPTGLRAGRATNVIPSEAEAVLDARTIPGCTKADVIADLRGVLGESAEALDFIVDSESPPLEFNANTPMFQLIASTLERHDSAAIPMPYMMTGATDAKHVARLGTTCYGFSPMKFKPGERFSDLVHGHDERIAIDSLGWGVRVLHEVVTGFCAQ